MIFLTIASLANSVALVYLTVLFNRHVKWRSRPIVIELHTPGGTSVERIEG